MFAACEKGDLPHRDGERKQRRFADDLLRNDRPVGERPRGKFGSVPAIIPMTRTVVIAGISRRPRGRVAPMVAPLFGASCDVLEAERVGAGLPGGEPGVSC